ncbi:MAG TPA: serine/threonine-protein kinase [Candidatus Xenobia bacterium]|jgi:tRNA A-37 threonylcarbamoyl transferase component Bud32
MTELGPGTRVADRYRIVRLLAEGGMSTVYEVQDERLPGRLVLKEMRDISNDPDIQAQIHAQFDREAETLARLSHPCLPRVIDCFHWNDKRYLVEDLVEGRTLEAVMEESSPRTPAEVVGWASQICEALTALHAEHLVYRDLKPSNVMLTPDGSIRLVDFGIVRSFALGKSRDTVVMGTPGFAAPEQYGTQQTDPRSDLYSLGVLMHHLLTGYDPSLTPFNLPALVDLDPGLAAVIGRALSIRIDERYPAAADMRAALLGEVGPLAEARFAWAQPGAVETRPTLGACAALFVFSLWHWEAAPFTGALGVFLTPFFAWLLAYTRRKQRWLKDSTIRTDTAGITVTTGRQVTYMAWSDVETAERTVAGPESRSQLTLRGAGRRLEIPLGSPQVLARVLDLAPLDRADALCQQAFDRAALNRLRA